MVASVAVACPDMAEPSVAERVARRADELLLTAENLVYVAVGVLLLASGVIVLVSTGYHLGRDLSDGTESTVTAALDGVLLVFILLELLAGLRRPAARPRRVPHTPEGTRAEGGVATPATGGAPGRRT